MLSASWIAAHAEDFDLFHVHFGFDALSPEELRQIVTALRERGKPLVFTVHDLRNPHHDSPDAHRAQLDVLIPAADALITLTPGAADEVETHWGRRPLVIPHPHVVEAHEVERALDATRHARGDRRFRVGVHVKSLRAGMDPLPVITALVELAEEDPEIVVQVNGHRDVLEPSGRRFEAALALRLSALAAQQRIELHVHDYLGDAELWSYLASLDASVLPYRFGTHSGWLEACFDLGTAVVAPNVGFFSQQGPVHSYAWDGETLVDASSLRAAVSAARGREAPRATAGERAAQRARIADAHEELYRRVLAERTRS